MGHTFIKDEKPQSSTNRGKVLVSGTDVQVHAEILCSWLSRCEIGSVQIGKKKKRKKETDLVCLEFAFTFLMETPDSGTQWCKGDMLKQLRVTPGLGCTS